MSTDRPRRNRAEWVTFAVSLLILGALVAAIGRDSGYSSGATTRFSAHVGQSGQPSPEPVRRTAAPVTMMKVRASRAKSVTRR